jgi:hypothetical protein
MSDKKHEAREFYVNSRFERLARRPDGLSREAALQRAQATVDDLKPGFAEWLETELTELKALFAGLDGKDAASMEGAYFRSAQLRDVGTPMGYALITFVAKNLCDALDTMKTFAVYDKEVVDCHLDALFLARSEPFRGLQPEQVPEMARGLQRVAAIASEKSANGRK